MLQSKPRREFSVWCQLKNRGFDVFYPCLRVNTVNPRARGIEPYFPEYIFVQVDLTAIGASTFAWIPHAIGLVYFGNEPAWVPDAVVFAIQRHLAAINSDSKQSDDQGRYLFPGKAAMDQNKPSDSLNLIIGEHLPSDERVHGLFQLLSTALVSTPRAESL